MRCVSDDFLNLRRKCSFGYMLNILNGRIYVIICSMCLTKFANRDRKLFHSTALKSVMQKIKRVANLQSVIQTIRHISYGKSSRSNLNESSMVAGFSLYFCGHISMRIM